MAPIQDLLNRIRWDRAFGQARFEIGYYDRIQTTLVPVPFESIFFPTGKPSFLDAATPDGIVHSAPLQRARASWRNGMVIWQR